MQPQSRLQYILDKNIFSWFVLSGVDIWLTDHRAKTPPSLSRSQTTITTQRSLRRNSIIILERGKPISLLKYGIYGQQIKTGCYNEGCVYDKLWPLMAFVSNSEWCKYNFFCPNTVCVIGWRSQSWPALKMYFYVSPCPAWFGQLRVRIFQDYTIVVSLYQLKSVCILKLHISHGWF